MSEESRPEPGPLSTGPSFHQRRIPPTDCLTNSRGVERRWNLNAEPHLYDGCLSASARRQWQQGLRQGSRWRGTREISEEPGRLGVRRVAQTEENELQTETLPALP